MNKPLHPGQLRSLTPLNALSSRQLQELRKQLIPQPLLAGELLFGPDSARRPAIFCLPVRLHYSTTMARSSACTPVRWKACTLSRPVRG